MLTEVTETGHGYQSAATADHPAGYIIRKNEGKKLKFTAQYDQNIPEDQKFAKATPSGTFEMWCDNPAALEQLQIGKQYYFDISEA